MAEVAPVVAKWKAMGYGVALQRDQPGSVEGAKVYVRQYLGYAEAVNWLSRQVLADYPKCEWIVAGGDDTWPDTYKRADEIAWELSSHFAQYQDHAANTWGIMQPTGDPWADSLGRIIERIAGSPWLGREWCRRAHAGKGPMWPEFRHMFVDEALQIYAQSLGVFLQRPDLTHFHAHAQRDGRSPAPAHMKEWNSQKHWQESKAIFERLKSTNFAECQPIS